VLNTLKLIYQFRWYILNIVQREFGIKYKNSFLGPAWSILNPLAMIFIYTVIFSNILKAKLGGLNQEYSYSIYLCIGIISWSLFSEILHKSVSIFSDYSEIIKKTKVPILIFPISAILNSLINFLIVFVLFVIFLILTNNLPYQYFFTFFIILIIQIFIASMLGLFLGFLNVFIKDISHFIGIFLQFWFWVTPIVYPVSIVPEWGRLIINLNPISSLMISYHQIFVYNESPFQLNLLYPISITLFFLLINIFLYKKLNKFIVDEL